MRARAHARTMKQSPSILKQKRTTSPAPSEEIFEQQHREMIEEGVGQSTFKPPGNGKWGENPAAERKITQRLSQRECMMMSARARERERERDCGSSSLNVGVGHRPTQAGKRQALRSISYLYKYTRTAIVPLA